MGFALISQDSLYPTHLSILQHHLDPVWVIGALGQNARDNAGRQCPSALILLLDNLHTQTGVDLTALGWKHRLILHLSYHHTTVQGVRTVHVQGVSDGPDPID